MPDISYTHERGQRRIEAELIRESAYHEAVLRLRAGSQPYHVIPFLREAYQRADRLERHTQEAA
jgi:hypothetical protein